MLYIASDHAGFQLKKYLAQRLKNDLEIEVKDLGPKNIDENDDFPDFAAPLSKQVTKSDKNFGILICGSGHGMCIAANKIKGARAIVGYSIQGAELARKHNNANILCLAGRILSEEHALAVTKTFLTTKFEAEPRFVRRNKKISQLE
ncbi:MAG: ribose-5-phosphate isomerase [Candidatus Magasanikbacteria bacterium CG10_big_fil_rev_8_21_14_0_10_36_32]|uniref:Ribose-5-phosphate isomerase n=1 Tax=Candidatus Magasanikbacteria bacterium CG10_big_fil_rev_8_21_14_0_10_36_32 TaxID=1974646 RepID=A0A2M6W6V6_9BACT|nr:MAG: ribose-5-phosphate isomerase [Candidatus Magasanikbacteria bacterium CG10_big_fil_rev_8_21_14_0_10_36_32]